MKRLAIIAAASFIATPALAVLASPYQRAAEFNAVIEAALPAFGVRVIEQVNFVHVDAYEVRSARCSLMVEIVDLAEEGEPLTIWRRQFEAVAGELECEK